MCCLDRVYLAGGAGVVSSAAGHTADPPTKTPWSPEQTADATEPSGPDGCPTYTHAQVK